MPIKSSGTLITESAERRIGFRCKCRWAYYTSKNKTSNALMSKNSHRNKLGCFGCNSMYCDVIESVSPFEKLASNSLVSLGLLGPWQINLKNFYSRS